MLVWLENAYSRPFLFVGGRFPPNDVTHRPNPKKDHPWDEPRDLSHKLRIFSCCFLNGPYKTSISHWFNITGLPEMFFGVIYGGVNISNLSSL